MSGAWLPLCSCRRVERQLATIAVPGAANNAATGTWAAMAAGAAMSVAGPVTSRICPTAAPKKVLPRRTDFTRLRPCVDRIYHTLSMHFASTSRCSGASSAVNVTTLSQSKGCWAHQTAAEKTSTDDVC